MFLGGKDRYRITCPVCKTSGNMYTRGGAYEGIFEIIGKSSNGGLSIKECPNCKTPLSYDPLSGKAKKNI